MKKYLLLIIFATLSLAFIATPVLAQEMPPEKVALYTKYYELKKGGEEGQKQAYEVAKEFLQKYGNDDDQYVKAVKVFVAAYEKLSREVPFWKAYNAKDYPKAFEAGRQAVNSDPENFAILASLARAGYLNAFGGNNSLNTEALGYAKRALELIDTNKVSKPDPFASTDEARGFLNYASGYFQRDDAPLDATKALIKAAQTGPTRTEPSTYYLLAQTILKGEYDPLEKEYNEKYKGKDETPESKAMFDKLIAVANRAIDAYARSVALSTKPEQAQSKSKALAELTDLYKSFHQNSDAGLSDLIATVLSKPLPQ